MQVKVKVFGAGSLMVSAVDPAEVLREIDFHLGITKALNVHKIRRGAPKKVKTVISEGAASATKQG